MAADTVAVGTDEYGCEAYRRLYEEIMYDIGKIASVDRSCLVLKPEVPLFIVSVKMKAKPAAKTIGAVANTRAERGTVYVSISDELYAPGCLSVLWDRYGRDNVQQIDRLEISVEGPSTSAEVDALEVESSEQPVREVLGALWRILPEGIRNRRTLQSDNVISVAATEEIMLPEHLQELQKVHTTMIEGGEYRV